MTEDERRDDWYAADAEWWEAQIAERAELGPLPNPFADYLCDWPGCTTCGDPLMGNGWAFWPRYYLWLPDGFYCPEHTAFMEKEGWGSGSGYFKDWPRDLSPEALEFQELVAGFAPLDSDEGQRIMREVTATERRAGFSVVTSAE
jgi:hypothetical protein